MRLLRFNGINIDIDEATAIGIDLQTYDIKNPAQRKINVSNSFTIPATLNNLNAIGYVGSVQNESNTIYDAITCDYWINNIQYITDAKLRVQNVITDLQEKEENGRIEVFVFEKPDIWDTLKGVDWYDFVQGFFTWLSVPKVGTPLVDSWTNFITPYTLVAGSGGLFLPIVKASPVNVSDDLYLRFYLATTEFTGNRNAGQMCAFVKTVFEYIEDTYTVDFNTGVSFDGNIWDDAVGGGMYWLFRDVYPVRAGDSLSFWWDVETSTSPINYGNDFAADETRDKTLYDFVLSFIQQLNILITQSGDNYKLRRFDDLESLAEVQDFSGNFTGKPTFKPYLEGLNQNNTIKFASIETGLSENTNERILTCLNKNIDLNTDLFKINAFIGNVTDNIGVYDEFVPDLTTKDSFKNFKFMVNNGQRTLKMDVRTSQDGPESDANVTDMYYAAYYSLASEYTLFDSALSYPKYYEHTKWMNALDLLNFEFFKLYWIRELNGSFFVNKIKGFNPDKSRQATELELIKVSSRTPYPVPPPTDLPFIVTVKTDNAGTSAINEMLMPIYGTNMRIITSEQDVTVSAPTTLTWAVAGTYEVKVYGMDYISFNYLNDKLKLVTIEQWGECKFTTMQNAFYGCNNVIGNYADTPDLSLVTNMSYMFNECSVFNSSIDFNTSNVTNMNRLLYNCAAFNQPVTLNTSSVTNMSEMFYNCSLFNSAITFSDTSLVTNMLAMFGYCAAFNQPVTLNTSSVTTMSNMFIGCDVFNKPLSFDTSSVTNMALMFTYCYSFNSAITFSDTSLVTNMDSMFWGCTIFDQDISGWDVSNVANFSNFMIFAGLSTTNYDALLVAWDALDLVNSLTAHFGSSQYTTTGETAKNSIITNDLWTFIDGGLA